MKLKFQCENILYEMDLGIKVRRTDTYLDHAKKALDGRVLPDIPQVTLKDRQDEFTKSMRAQRNKLHPRSENLSEMVKNIVNKMEHDFEGLDNTMHSTSGLDHSWKTNALELTLKELPKIPISNTEIGASPGFASSLYIPPDSKLSSTVIFLLQDISGTNKYNIYRHQLG